MAALDRAVALAEVDAVAVRVEQDLDLDVAGALDEPLEDQPVVAEAAAASRRAAASASRQLDRLADGPHALAAAAGRRLDEQRVADPVGGRDAAPGRSGPRRRSPARTGTPSACARRRAAALSPIARIAAGGGPTQRSPAAHDRSAKSAFSARNPKPGWIASAPAARAAATTAAAVEEVEGAGPVGGRHDRVGCRVRSQVRAIRAAISPRLAMKTRSDGMRLADAGRAG